jgi:hypothetical protein
MKALPQALEIIFEMQRKKSNEKLTKKRSKLFAYKTQFLNFFLSLDPFPIFKPHNFLISYSF